MDRAAENHYPTSPLAEIKALDVKSIAAPDCVLFLWATVPMLEQGLKVMKHWGFEYKSHAIWAKDRVGTGYWFRNQHEILLVGTRGHVPAPAMGTQWSSLIQALVRRHSEKPEVFCEMIEGYFPTLPKIELHARGPIARPGWDVWGLEAPGLELAGDLVADLSPTLEMTPHVGGPASEDRGALPQMTTREASRAAQDAPHRLAGSEAPEAATRAPPGPLRARTAPSRLPPLPLFGDM
jgi:N6-adenosine-specific RNA methylase IME4